MKITKTIFIIIFSVGIYSVQTSAQEPGFTPMQSIHESADSSVLEFYLQYSTFTDPGKFTCLYKNLPDSLTELCHLIKSQFIHPYAELSRYRELIPKERWNEIPDYPTVQSILEGLITHDSAGIIAERKPEDRLILGCRAYSILLASIMKYRGIPVRVRCGHATYLVPDFHASHTLCEVWNEKEQRWMLVDPGTGMVDFGSDKFDFSHEAWLQMRDGEIDPSRFGFPGRYSGLVSIAGKVCTDLASILGNEYTLYQYAPLLDYIFTNNQLTAEQTEILNKVSVLMKSMNADNLRKLQEIYDNTPLIQITRTLGQDSTTAGNTAGTQAN